MTQTPDPQGPGQPEYLEQGGGRALEREPSSRRRRVLVPVLAGLGLAAVGGAAFGAWWFLDEGAQAAEALPATSIGYVGLTLDPSGSQKLEALRTLEKFPWVAEELELEGDLGGVDLRQEVGEFLLEESGCEDLSYADDLESWLGERWGVAAVALGGEDPEPLFALEVRDADAATDGLATIAQCAAEQDSTAYAVDGDWALAAGSQEALERAQQLVEDEGTLADDADFRRWSEELEPGLLTLYAAPAAGALVVDHWDEVMGFDPGLGASLEPPADVVEAAEQFEGGIAQVRFDEAGLELELAGSMGDSELLTAFDGDAGALAADLPADTALVYSYGLGEGWTDWMAELIESDPTAGIEPGDVELALQETTGMGLQDVAAAAGEAIALAVGGDVDAQALFDGTLESVPAALVMDGEEEPVRALADALAPFLGPDADLLGITAGDDVVAVGPHAGWREEVAEGGDLGDSERFRDVVPDNGELVSVVYADVDVVSEVVIGFMEALEEAFSTGFGDLPGAETPAEDDTGMTDVDEVRENLEPLAAFGSSSWIDDDSVFRGLMRISTD